MFYRIIISFLACTLATPSMADILSNHNYIQIDGGIGHVNGFLMTPIGGAPGTTSSERPTLSELGIHRFTPFNLRLGSEWDQWGGYLGYAYRRFNSAHAVSLSSDLLTHGMNFPTGSLVTSHNQFDWTSAGAYYRMDLQNGLIISPVLEIDYWQFRYDIHSSIKSTSRRYNDVTLRAGLRAAYQLNNKITLNAEGFTALPFGNLRIDNVSLEADYNLYQQGIFTLSPYVGASYEHFKFKDHQRVPNYLVINEGPMFFAGLKINF